MKDRSAPLAAEPPRDQVDAERRVTGLLFRTTFAFWEHFVARAAEQGLAPAQAQALAAMSPAAAVAMSELAAALNCDPSTITGLADRLEAHGLIERQAMTGDRRVKALMLTEAGRSRRTLFIERLDEPPQSVASLGSRPLANLADALERLLAAETAARSAATTPRAGPRHVRPPATPPAQGAGAGVMRRVTAKRSG